MMRRLLLVGLAWSVVALACGVDESEPIEPGRLSEAAVAPVDDDATSTVEDEATTLAAIDRVTELTIQDLEQWWEVELPVVFGSEWVPLGGYGPYYPSRGDIPSCGGALEPAVFEGNAFYCWSDDTVQWDAEGLMLRVYHDFGDFAVALAIAHEWGHAVEARIGYELSAHPTIVTELLADCLLGAWTGRVAREESDLLRLQHGDLEEAMGGFLLIGDRIGGDPDDHDAHGGSFDRLNAFTEGFQDGSAECATYVDSPPEVVFIPFLADPDHVTGEGLDLSLADTAPLVIAALESFWTTTYAEVFGEEWMPVSANIPYLTSSGSLPVCTGSTHAEAFYEQNAFYCASDDFVAWDDEGFFPDLHDEIGDFAIGLILAEMYGHAVQNRAGLPLYSHEAQRQADCLSGVFTAALVPVDNPYGLHLAADDLEEGISGFLTFCPIHEQNFGTLNLTAFDRFESFNEGFFSGIDGCGLW